MPGSTKLIGGLNGAIGCTFVPSTNQLVLVEYDTGKLDSFDTATSTLKILGTGYNQPESVVVAADGTTAYVTERVGNLLAVNFATAARAQARVVASGLNTPQQIALDEAHACAYVVEYANPGRLLRIELTSGTIKVITNALEFAVGIALTSDLSTAYVSEQATSGGRIRKVALATGVISNFATGLTSPFFLTWLNNSQQALFVPERDPANRISVVNLSGGAPVVVVSPTAFRPSSVAMAQPGHLMIACNEELDGCNLMMPVTAGADDLLLGIGFVPVLAGPTDGITSAGLANTSTAAFAGYFYQVTNAPFGGTLPIMINHAQAYNMGARYYCVKANGVAGMDVWTDLKLDTSTGEFVTTTMSPVTIGSTPGCYKVREPGDVWLNGNLGDLLSSTGLPYGQATIEVDFVTATGAAVATSNAAKPLIDNAPCVAVLSEPTLLGNTANSVCGYLPYTKPPTAAPVTIAYTASQPNNHATFSLEVWKGVMGANTVYSADGNVPSPATFTVPLNQLLGSCIVAGCAADLYVAASAINGWDRQSQYDAWSQEAFALAPSTN
jgi:hypothetical protein